MPIVTSCPECTAKIRVSDNAVGKQIKCPKCGKAFPVSAGPAPAAPTPTPAPPKSSPRIKPAPSPPPEPFALEELSGLASEPEREPAPPPEPEETAPPERPKPSRRPAPDFMAFLRFQVFITPSFGIHVLFIVWAGYCVYWGGRHAYTSLDAFGRSASVGLELLSYGLGLMILGPILVRVICETIVAIFRILETLKER
jgi:predicted Zn finger-like uncharacterized protein